jgi:hypothetical protein
MSAVPSTFRSTRSTRFTSLGKKPSHPSIECRLYLFEARGHDRPSRHEHHVRRGPARRAPSSKHLPQHALRPVSAHCAPDLAAGYHAQTQRTPRSFQYESNKERVHETLPFIVHPMEITISTQALGAFESAARSRRHTARRCRPFRRRRARTARPAFVRMRMRKPCAFFRRRRFGWNVLFIPKSLRARISLRLAATPGSQVPLFSFELPPRRKPGMIPSEHPTVNQLAFPKTRAAARISSCRSLPPCAKFPPSPGRHWRTLFIAGMGSPVGWFFHSC